MNIRMGEGHSRFSPYHVLDEGGRGCWELEVDIPDILGPYKTASGTVAIEPGDGFAYLLDEVLSTSNGQPCLSVMGRDDMEKHYILKVLSRMERSTSMYL